MHTENAAVEVMADGTVIWWGGTVHDGLWMPEGRCYWMGGCWRDGIVIDGVFEQCDWYYGEKRGGHFRTRVRWYDGVHRGGKFEGLWLGGLWLDGEFCGFKNRDLVPPNQTIDDESFVGRHRIFIGREKEFSDLKDGVVRLNDQMTPAMGECPKCKRKYTILYPHMEGEVREYLCGECDADRKQGDIAKEYERLKKAGKIDKRFDKTIKAIVNTIKKAK